MQQEEGVALETSVENLGVDLRMSTKQLGAKEKPRRKKCDVRFSLIRKHRIFQKNYRRTGVRKLLRTVLARAWRGEAVGIAPRERLKLRRQMAAAAGKKESVSLSPFMEVNNLEVEEELSTVATLDWAEGVWLGRWEKRAAKGWEEADLRSTTMETGERACRSSFVRNSRLGHQVATVAHLAS